MSRKKSSFWTSRNTALAAIIFAIPFIVLAFLLAYNQPSLSQIDYNIGNYLHQFRSPDRTKVIIGLTTIGDGWSQTVLTLVISLLLFALKEFKAGIWYLFTMLVGAQLLNSYIKDLFARTRPDYINHLVFENSYAFPSGHAMGTMILFAGLAFLVYRLYRAHHPVFKGLVVVLCLSLTLSIGLSRIYLGVHYPSDVLAGWSLGAGFLFLSIAAFGLWATD
ncbi:phosphatidylglycerophosphatase B [Alloiococcus otitis]|uniref:Phosphatidic acid phosphatase type 2/haloperoxidase domain-containing protein n=1 Tax=Alloiococcus otitis ATCC 51267 TaxID=883081 RepID=K9E718_9LACT|nr:phosphatase PAP2 family protein [Alloiococcus otitis]EKU92949.1 hypothetical protein HMPREF9698_01552 [Alloiococcus otitis ATCC 51267]SUU80460.1 phosphatidylglycerophosphatase B [Alloiococcus otitis]